jgi:hypothetical protein
VGEANGGKKTKPLTAKRHCLFSSKSSKLSASVFSICFRRDFNVFLRYNLVRMSHIHRFGLILLNFKKILISSTENIEVFLSMH